MRSTNTRNLSALRESIKHEDAALESRLPAAAAPAAAGKRTPRKTATPATSATVKAAAKPVQARAPAKPASTVTKPAPVRTRAKPATATTVKPTTVKPAAAPRPTAPKTSDTPIKKPDGVATPATRRAPAESRLAAPMPASTPTKGAKAKDVSKTKAEKLVKDSFELTRSELALLKSLRTRLGAKGVTCTKSGLLRAGLAALLKLDEAALGALAQGFAKAPKVKRKKKA